MGNGHGNEYVIFNEESSQKLYRKWTRKFADRNVPMSDQLFLKNFLLRVLHTQMHVWTFNLIKIANEKCQQDIIETNQ